MIHFDPIELTESLGAGKKTKGDEDDEVVWPRVVRGLFPFFLQESILWGHDLLIKGLGWSIRNGSLVQVWSDNWIPSISFFEPFVNWGDEFLSLKVANLMNKDLNV